MVEEKSLTQSGIFETREFEITDDGIAVSVRALFFRNRYKVPFEHIIREPVEFTLSSSGWRWGGIGCLIFSCLFFFVTVVEKKGLDGALVSLAFLAAALVSLIGYRLTMRTFLRISEASMNIDLAAANPSRERVEEFIEAVTSKTQDFYGNFQQFQPSYDRVGQIERLAFLLDKGVLTQDEFEVLKSELVNPLKISELPQAGQYL